MLFRRATLSAMFVAVSLVASAGLSGQAFATLNLPIVNIPDTPTDIPNIPVDDNCALGDPACAAAVAEQAVSCTCHVHLGAAASGHAGVECHVHAARIAQATQTVCENPDLLAGLTRRQVARLPH